MIDTIDEIVTIWHTYFEDEEMQYSEFESSDIEYFVGCMLYNHFNFSQALATMKTMDLSYDFLTSCGSSYERVKELVESINIDSEDEKLEFLEKFIVDSKAKYSGDELYLLDRLTLHVDGLAKRQRDGIIAQNVDFNNPLYR